MQRILAYALLSLALLGASVHAEIKHKVRRGETLTEIAQAYKISLQAIKTANGISDANKIRVGQTLVIPADEIEFIEYKIRRGDALSDIAKKHGITLRQLASFNNIRNANRIRVGQVIRIPVPGGANATQSGPQLPAELVKTLSSIKTKSTQWRHIVIHHSASASGSAKSFDRFHREERRMPNGLAYHFVIGNGRGMEDGEIQIGNRWKKQIEGGHLTSYALNQISIGICLVGDFQKTKPTTRQMKQLEALVKYLMKRTNIPVSRVTTHTLIHPKHTLCPGKNFPTKAFRKALEE